MPALEQYGAGQSVGPQRPQLRHRLAGPRDHEPFAACDTVDDVTAFVSEVSDAHSFHGPIVSRVRHLVKGGHARIDRNIHVERFNRARRFYERLGFREIADRGVYLLLERPGASR
jgi:hypothetical protein